MRDRLETKKDLNIKPIKWEGGKKLNENIGNNFSIPGYGEIQVDIQSISDDAFEKIMTERSLLKNNIPSKNDVILPQDQSEYYKKVKQQIIDNLLDHRFAIISGPTGTGKTTIVQTIAREMGLEIYEVGADQDKTVDDFAKSVKTYKTGNMLQIKEVPGYLLKAITKGGIFLVNEANSLPADVQLALANMTENEFIVVGTKKYRVHPNFFLVFTSNEGYAGTNEYNTAVIRKAGGFVNFDYEPELDGEFKIVKTIYKKIKEKLKTITIISDEDLKVITTKVRELREYLREYNNNPDNEKFLSQDFNDFWHFLYIRFYEKLITEILSSESTQISLKEKILELVKNNIHEVIHDGGISHTNDIEKLESIISKVVGDHIISLDSNEQKHFLSKDLLEGVLGSKNLTEEGRKIIEKNFDTSTIENNNKKGNSFFMKKGINPNLFKKILNNEVKSAGEKLKRIEKIDQIAQDMYEKLVDSRKEKIIGEINIRNDEIYGTVLDVEIDGQIITFKVKDGKNFNLNEVKTKDDVLNKVFGNDDLEIVFDGEIFENVFSHPKSLEIRRFSKQIEIEKNGTKYVVFLGFRGEIRDIRYIGEETGKYYIPQSKVNDLLLSSYKISEDVNDLKDNKHYLALNENNELVFATGKELKKRLSKGEKLSILEKADTQDIEKEIRKRFANLDKLNLHNGGEEKAETGTAVEINPAYPLQKIVDNTKENFLYITETTAKNIARIIKKLSLGEDVLLVGHSGVGKSSYAKEVAKRMNLPYIDLQITSELTESDVSSNLKWNEGEIEEQMSPFLDTYVNGGIVELKELNMAAVTTFLHNFMDKNGKIIFQNKIYTRHPDFHIIATVNYYDTRLFPGVNPLNLATQARFSVINVDYLGKEEELELILEATKQGLIKTKLNEKEIKEISEFILSFLIYPIREKIEHLRKTQGGNTSELLEILSKKNLTVNTLLSWIQTSQNIEEIKEKIKSFYTFSDEEKELFDDELSKIFSVLKGLS